MKNYHFDKFTNLAATSGYKAILASKRQITHTVTAIVLMKDSCKSFLPREVWLTFAESMNDIAKVMENKIVFNLNYPKAPVPFHIDYIDEQDSLLPELMKKFDLKSDWGRIELLRLILNIELEASFRDMAIQLKVAGIAIQEDTALYWMDDDGMDIANNQSFYEKILRKELNLSFSGQPAALAAFAKYCFQCTDKQEWLRRLL